MSLVHDGNIWRAIDASTNFAYAVYPAEGVSRYSLLLHDQARHETHDLGIHGSLYDAIRIAEAHEQAVLPGMQKVKTPA